VSFTSEGFFNGELGTRGPAGPIWAHGGAQQTKIKLKIDHFYTFRKVEAKVKNKWKKNAKALHFPHLPIRTQWDQYVIRRSATPPLSKAQETLHILLKVYN